MKHRRVACCHKQNIKKQDRVWEQEREWERVTNRKKSGEKNIACEENIILVGVRRRTWVRNSANEMKNYAWKLCRDGEKKMEEEWFNTNVYFPEKAKIVHGKWKPIEYSWWTGHSRTLMSTGASTFALSLSLHPPLSKAHIQHTIRCDTISKQHNNSYRRSLLSAVWRVFLSPLNVHKL